MSHLPRPNEECDDRMDLAWCCPACRGALRTVRDDVLSCTGCDANYGVFGAIPDLRVDRPAWIDIDEDRDAAARLDRDYREKSLESMVRAVFEAQHGRSQDQIDMRTRQVLAAPDRLATQLDGWLRAT